MRRQKENKNRLKTKGRKKNDWNDEEDNRRTRVKRRKTKDIRRH
jgi:hypothetical protein